MADNISDSLNKNSQPESERSAVGRLLEEAQQIPAKLWREISVVGGGTGAGAVKYGLSNVTEHPGRFGLELAGAAGLALALRGPSWARVPAALFVSAGTIGFSNHIKESMSATLPIMAETWVSDRNMSNNRQRVAETMGPLAFDTVAMGIVFHKTSGLAERLHKTNPKLMLESVDNKVGALTDLAGQRLGFNNLGPQLAFEGGPRIPRPTRAVELNEPMYMTAQNKGGGGDPLNYKYYRNHLGESVHDFDNARISGRRGNSVEHRDGRQGFFAYDGKVAISFPGGRASYLDIGEPIHHVQSVRKLDGNIEYTFNKRSHWDVMVQMQDRVVAARLRNGDIEIHMDTQPSGPTVLAHTDGSTTIVQPNGLIRIDRPGYPSQHQALGIRVARVCSTEHTDRSCTIHFISPEGRTNSIQLNRLPPVPPLTQPLPRPHQPVVPPVAPPGRTGADIAEPMRGTGGRGSGSSWSPIEPPQSEPLFTFRPNIPRSPHRAIADHLLGIDHRLMPDNSLSSPADAHLAMLDIPNVLKEHFAKLGKH